MRLLITGASGFVGRQVLAYLLGRGISAFVVGRTRPDVEGAFEWLQLDLLLRQSPEEAVGWAKPHLIIHLAWFVQQGAFWNSELNADWVRASVALARAAAQGGLKRFVGIGTCYEYEWPAQGDCDEHTTPIRPSTTYGVSKDAARQALSDEFSSWAIDFAWARLFFLFGPHEAPTRLVPSVCRALAGGREANCSRGLAVRDFMDVRDAGRAIGQLALSHMTGPVNIASGESTSVAQVAQLLGELAKRPDLIRLGALPDRPGEPPRITATSRLRSELGFQPYLSLREGLRDALSMWKAATAENA
jgi:nucleoside-diphosphate-sugar epimerase